LHWTNVWIRVGNEEWGGRASETTEELRPDIIPGCKGNRSDEREKANDGRFWLAKFRDWAKKGISMPHPTRDEAKPIQSGNEFLVYVEKTVLPLYQRFKGCDFEAKEGAMFPQEHIRPATCADARTDCDEADYQRADPD
jgi:hypothetical protein